MIRIAISFHGKFPALVEANGFDLPVLISLSGVLLIFSLIEKSVA